MTKVGREAHKIEKTYTIPSVHGVLELLVVEQVDSTLLVKQSFVLVRWQMKMVLPSMASLPGSSRYFKVR